MPENASPRVSGIVLAGAYPDGKCALDRLAPRALLPVAQQPLINHVLRWMRAGGVRRVTVCTNSAARAVRDGLDRATEGPQLDYLEDFSPRGAAGCVRDAGLRSDAQTFLVAEGTTVPVVDVGELLKAHREASAAVTVVVGADSGGRLRPTGVYVFDRWTFEFIPEEGFYDIKEKLIPRLYGAGETVSTHIAREMPPRVMNADSYLALNHWAIERAREHVQASDGFRAHGEALVHETARVDPAARLIGPVLVGPRVSVAARATLVGPVSVGRDSQVGEGAVVSRSVIWAGCRVGEGAFVDRCLLADGSRVGARKVLVSALEATDRRRPPQDLPSGLGGRPFWAPLVAALRPPATDRP